MRKCENAKMIKSKEIAGYVLGGVMFVVLLPTIMWLASGMPALEHIGASRAAITGMLILGGLALSIWTIVYMKRHGKGNPMDAFDHEIGPRTQHLMTDGPYRLNRNPMLTGTFIYLLGYIVWLWTWQALLVWLIFVIIMLVQVLSEEKRLRRDFGDEYEAYCRRTGRFLPVADWQSFRAWQEHPTNYQMDESEHVCSNCGHTFTGNYCPVCSQSARHGRITWLAIWQGIGQLWGIESRSALFTLWQLLLRPGYLVRDYISGKRQVSYPPVKLLFILAAVVALVQYFFPVPPEEASQTGYKYIDFAFDWMSNHQSLGELLTGCFFILPTWLLFRKAPAYPNHTIPEGFFLQVYIAILSYIIQVLLAGPNPFVLILTMLYSFATYKQLFGYGYWQTLWRWALCSVLSFATLLALVISAILIDVACK